MLYGTDGNVLYDLTGTGTANKLYLDSEWTAAGSNDNGGSWLGLLGAGTITYLGDEFVYPTLRGDVTGDGNVDVSDVNAVVNIILGNDRE